MVSRHPLAGERQGTEPGDPISRKEVGLFVFWRMGDGSHLGAKGTGMKKEGPGRTLGPKDKVILLFFPPFGQVKFFFSLRHN
jgi:hypothetical protein